MRKIIKYTFKIVIFFAILYCLYIPVDKLLGLKTRDGIMQARTMYDQPKNTVDVVFMGASFVHCGINTASLWIDYGIAAYDYSAAEQPAWITYYYLKEICKYQNPKLVVLDVDSIGATTSDYSYIWLYDNLAGFRFSFNKLKMLIASCETDRLFEFFPSIMISHNRYKELGDEDYNYFMSSQKDRANFKGYTPHFKEAGLEGTEWDTSLMTPITEKSYKYLKKIIEYADKEGIELYLVATPYNVEEDRQGKLNYLEGLAQIEGITFHNYNDYRKEMGIDIEKDMKDLEHLNYSGGCKYTDYLGRTIKDMYDIPDRRGMEEYSSWYMNLEEIWNMAAEYGQ